MRSTAVIEVTGLTMSYGPREVLRGVDFHVGRGEVVALLGPNGAGKSTTIEILEGFRAPSGGRVRVLGEDPLHADEGWDIPLDGAPEVTRVGDEPAGLILAFFRSTAELLAELDDLGERIRPDGMIWAAWPRKAAGHVSDLSDSVVREAALARGLVDVKVAAIDTDWSGLKLVWRLANR